MDVRTCVVNQLLFLRFGIPVISVAVALRRCNLEKRGRLVRDAMPPFRTSTWFDYDIVKAWEWRLADLRAAGPRLMVFAPVTDEGAAELQGTVREVLDLINRAADSSQVRAEMQNAMLLMMGLRYNKEEIRRTMMNLQGIEESVYHQMILEQGMHKGHKEGRAEGIVEGRAEGLLAEGKNLALVVGRLRFSTEPPQEVRDEIMACQDRDRVERMVAALTIGPSWAVVLET